MKFIHKLIGTLPFFILFVDMVNGYFLYQGSQIPIGQMFKFLVTFLLFVGLVDFSVIKSVVWILLSFSFIVFANLNNLYEGELDLFFKGLIHSQKFFYTVLVYIYFCEYFKNGYNLNIRRILLVNIGIILLNILLTLLGIGFYAYHNTVGFIGFFFAQNELSYVLLIIFSFKLISLYHKNTIVLFYNSIILLVLAALVGMKIGIGGVFLISLFLLLLKSNIWHKLIAGLAFVIGFIILFPSIRAISAPLWGMWQHKFNQTGNLFLFLLSGRNEFLKEEIYNFLDGSVVNYIFGFGQNLTVEMDVFDTLFNYGLYGLLIVYGFFIFVLLKGIVRLRGVYRQFYVALLMFLFVISSIAGHFIYSAVAGFFFAFLFSYITYKRINLS